MKIMKMNKSYILLLLMLFIYSSSFAQRNEQGVKVASEAFNKALIFKDSVALKKLLHNSLSYGHSNGWIETKREFIDDLFNGTITYNDVKTEKVEVVAITNRVMTLRADVVINADYKGMKGLEFHLHSMQTWKWQNMMGWVMVNRQSVGIKDK